MDIIIVIILIIIVLAVTMLLSTFFKEEDIKKEVLDFLPKHDCKKCGFDDCFAFTDDIILDITNLDKCPVISDLNKKEIIALMRKKKKG